ncbi:helix-turn-helix transcriptional regulator [Streptosporangium canum]|uniref:helix-turn-helix transcriptional regulator n=1 Tax=Streptosporangium canum TaxID=324952 RepID=UPI00368FC654
MNEAIRARREAIKLSQARLADVAGVSTGTIRNAEAGKPLEGDTRDKIERALGWRPGTVEPLFSGTVMAALAESFLQFSDPRDTEQWTERRRILHTLIGDLGRGVLSNNTLTRARDALFQFMTGAATGQLADEMDEIMRGEGSIPVVAATIQGTLPALTSRMEGVVTDPETRIRAEQLDALAQSATVRASVQAPSEVTADKLHAKAWERARERGARGLIATTQMEVPSEILTEEGVGYIFAVAPLPDDVLAELDKEDVEWLAETLCQHGIELARGIVETKRRARAIQRTERQQEEEL